MSFLVKGIKMPKSCLECELIDGAEAPDCFLMYRAIKNPLQRQDYCPLVEIPEKHGRLIDGDYLYDRLKTLGLKDENVFRIIKEEPTVVESEE